MNRCGDTFLYLHLDWLGLKRLKKGNRGTFMQGVVRRSCRIVGDEMGHSLLRTTRPAVRDERGIRAVDGCADRSHLLAKFEWEENFLCVRAELHLCQRQDPVALRFLCLGSDGQRPLRL